MPNNPSRREFLVVPDTNSIWTNEKDPKQLTLFQRSFREKWEAITAAGDATLVIPEVVFLEIASQKTRAIAHHYSQGRRNLTDVTQTLGLEMELPAEMDSKQIAPLVVKRLREEMNSTPRCKEYTTHYKLITEDRLKEIVQASIWRWPPFKAGSDEGGFRDAILLETVYTLVWTNIHTDVALITKDGRRDRPLAYAWRRLLA